MGAWEDEDGGVGGGGRASGRKGAGTDKVEEQKRETDKGSELPERRGGGKVAMKAGSEKSKRQRLANEKCRKRDDVLKLQNAEWNRHRAKSRRNFPPKTLPFLHAKICSKLTKKRQEMTLHSSAEIRAFCRVRTVASCHVSLKPSPERNPRDITLAGIRRSP